MSIRKTTLAPVQLLRSVHMKKSYIGKAGYPVLSVTGVRPCAEAKLIPGSLSCPRAMSCPGIMRTGPKCCVNGKHEIGMRKLCKC